MKRDFRMTDDDLEKLLTANEADLDGMPPESPQARANRAWCELGQRMGFDGMTVEPLPCDDLKRFKAEPLLIDCVGCGRPNVTEPGTVCDICSAG
jgi:hypothetical protein